MYLSHFCKQELLKDTKHWKGATEWVLTPPDFHAVYWKELYWPPIYPYERKVCYLNCEPTEKETFIGDLASDMYFQTDDVSITVKYLSKSLCNLLTPVSHSQHIRERLSMIEKCVRHILNLGQHELEWFIQQLITYGVLLVPTTLERRSPPMTTHHLADLPCH